MLGKLIKYDFRSLNRFLIIMHAFLLLSAVFIRVLFTGRIHEHMPDSQLDFTVLMITVLCVIIITAISFGTQLIIAARFYKNLFTDEGYLTRTLPVTNRQHLLSKTITGSIWCFLDIVLIFLSMYVVLWTPYIQNVLESEKEVIRKEFGLVGKYADLSFPTILGVYLLFSILSSVAGIMMIYAAVALGQLFSSHRVLGAVVAYFVLSTLISVLSLIFMYIFGDGTSTLIIMRADQTSTQFNFIDYMLATLKPSAAMEVLTSIALSILTLHIMDKKTNLI